MKVISGILKGRNIKGYDIDGTRPTMDRVKESLFASIQDYIKNSIVLDLFAGSGNLGIEAISNGSSKCYFVDNNKKCIKVINDNIISKPPILFNTNAIIPIVKKYIELIPPERPSKPSIKFIQLIHPNMKKIVIG